MSRSLAIVIALATGLAASPVAAQVQVVEEGEATQAQVVERGYVRGQGRGIQYGAHFVSPVYLSSVTPAGTDQPVAVGGGLGVLGRIGWEFPSGFTIEALGGFAANGVDTNGNSDMSNVLMRAEVGLGLRYMFFNETAFVPFVQLGATLRWHFFDYADHGTVAHGNDQVTPALHGAVGFQIELSPYFGIEAGCMVEYVAWGKTFEQPGYVSITPFAGVTLYVYDESGY